MKKHFIYLLFLLLATTQCTEKKEFLHAEGTRIVHKGENVLLRGFGLGGWVLQEPYMLRLSGIVNTQQELKDSIAALIGDERMQAFYEAWRTNGIQKQDIDSLAAWGFNSVRLPMHYNLYTLPIAQEPVAGQQSWLEKGFALTDSLLAWCKANHMYLMLDLHAAPGGQGNDVAISDASELRLWQSEENKTKTIALWRKLAERYANEEWIGGYDIINEPNYGFQDPEDRNGLAEQENAPLRQLMVEITRAIREVDTNHLIIIEGNGWGNNYNGIFPLWDNNMAISFHKYWNFNDPSSIAHFLKIREEQNAPLWMSESGENSNAWFTDAIRLFEANNIGWCWWTYKRIGLGCPMEIIVPEGYNKLLDYWSGKGPKPTAEESVEILTRLAENYKISHTVFHKGYIDALIRQAGSEQSIAFKPHLLPAQGTYALFASDYDMGRSGSAYHDKDSANYRVSDPKQTGGNRGHQYRNDGVDISRSSNEGGNGYCISYTEGGEWLQYTLQAETEGEYALAVTVASPEGKGSIRFTMNGIPAGNEISFAHTGGYDHWKSFEAGHVKAVKGENIFRVYIGRDGFNLERITFSRQ